MLSGMGRRVVLQPAAYRRTLCTYLLRWELVTAGQVSMDTPSPQATLREIKHRRHFVMTGVSRLLPADFSMTLRRLLSLITAYLLTMYLLVCWCNARMLSCQTAMFSSSVHTGNTFWCAPVIIKCHLWSWPMNTRINTNVRIYTEHHYSLRLRFAAGLFNTKR